MKFVNSPLIKQFNLFFSSNKEPLGSKKRILELLDNFPQSEKEKLNYLIAGSWAIEIISNKKIKHDDIDLIVLQNPPYYIDDATEIEEKCLNVIPLDLVYFKDNLLKREFEGREVYVLSDNLQVCLKLIGQLQERLPERAILQLKILLDSYENFNREESKKEILYILTRLTPEDLDHDNLAEQIINSIDKYGGGEKEEAINNFLEIHSIINKSLRREFKKRKLTKKIGISEK